MRLASPAHLEVYDHGKHKDGGHEVQEVGQVLPVEALSQGAHLVRAGGQEMKHSNDGSLKLSTWITGATRLAIIMQRWTHLIRRDSALRCSRTSARVDGGGAEGLPDDRLADVGCDEERDTGAQTVALLEQLIQQQDNQTCDKELKKRTPGLYRGDSGRPRTATLRRV